MHFHLKSSAVALSRQGPIEPTTPIHVLSRLAFGDFSYSTYIISSHWLSFCRIKPYWYPKFLHHLNLILIHHLFYSFTNIPTPTPILLVLVLFLLFLLFFGYPIHKIRNFSAPVPIPFTIIFMPLSWRTFS